MKLLDKTGFYAIAAAALLAASQWAGGAKPPRAEHARDVRKADYIYLESTKYQAQEKNDAYYDLVEAAYELNPDDPFLAKEYGIRLIVTSANDSAMMERGIALMKPYVENNPDDWVAATGYGAVLNKLGRTAEVREAFRKLYESNSNPTLSGPIYASILAQSGDTADIYKAIGVLTNVEAIEGGTNNNTVMRKMQYYLMAGDTTAVIDEARSLVRSNPSSIAHLTMLGDVYMQLDMPDSALAVYNRAVEMDPTSGMAYYSRANYYSQMGDSTAFDREVFQALMQPDLDYEPKVGILYNYVSKLYDDSTQRDRIENMFQTLVDQYPHEADVRFLYGDYLVTISQYGPAAEQIRYALDADPDDEGRWRQLTSLFFINKENDKALQTVEDAVRYFPDNAGLYELGAVIASGEKLYDRAFGYYDKALARIDSTDIDAFSNLLSSIGDTYYGKGNTDSAFVYYRKAIAVNPDNYLALNNCAYHLACEDRDLDKALEMIEKAVANDPENVTSLDTYAWVLFKRKEYAKAKEMIDAVLESEAEESSSADVLEHAGDIYFMNGEPDEALEFWKQALEENPDNELLRRKVKNKTFFFK